MKYNEFFSNLTDLELWENSMQLLNGLDIKGLGCVRRWNLQRSIANRC